MNLMGIFDNESQTTSNSATNEEKIGELNKSRPAVEVASISLQFVSTKKHRVHMSTTGIDDLPPEMFCELFEHPVGEHSPDIRHYAHCYFCK